MRKVYLLALVIMLHASLVLAQAGSIGYGACKFSPIHVLTINYLENGTTPTSNCCFYYVFGDPHLRPNCPIQMVDCDGNAHQATGGAAILNPNPACNCSFDERFAAAPSFTCPVAAEATTWGRLKALYGE